VFFYLDYLYINLVHCRDLWYNKIVNAIAKSLPSAAFSNSSQIKTSSTRAHPDFEKSQPQNGITDSRAEQSRTDPCGLDGLEESAYDYWQNGAVHHSQ